MFGRGIATAALSLRCARRSMATFPTPGERLGSLRRLMAAQEVVRVLEVHNGLTGLIAEHAAATRPDGTRATFDAMWSSSLTASASKVEFPVNDHFLHIRICHTRSVKCHISY